MTELKTIKDITETVWNVEVTPEEYFVLVRNLRAEAIKWAKHYKESIIASWNLDTSTHFSDVTYSAKISFIKEFFNISEEDLK